MQRNVAHICWQISAHREMLHSYMGTVQKLPIFLEEWGGHTPAFLALYSCLFFKKKRPFYRSYLIFGHFKDCFQRPENIMSPSKIAFIRGKFSKKKSNKFGNFGLTLAIWAKFGKISGICGGKYPKLANWPFGSI